MELVKGVHLDYADGKIKLSGEWEVRALVVAELDKVKAKLESGELDPVKGTDLDKELLMKAIEALKALV